MGALFFLPLMLGSWPLLGVILSPSSPLDLGYRQLYNLQFEEAHQTFQSWGEIHPDDPMGPTSEAAAYLFYEFDRLGVLQSELFLDNEKFKGRRIALPDESTKSAFEKAIAKSEELANTALQHSPQDKDVLFAKVLNLGLQADYLALIEKRDLASLSYMKEAGLLAERLLTIDPTYYDAYLAVGIENYMLGLTPVPVRWILRLYGAETDKERGIKDLELTAEKGHYLLPYARLLLAVAALRDKNQTRARELLQELSQEFPNNQLYKKELARL